METWNRLIVVGGEERDGEWRKEGEGISQRACMNNSWTWTTESGLNVSERDGLGGGGQKRKQEIVTTVIE